MILAIGHPQLQDESARDLRLPLRALFDVATVAPAIGGSVDWDRVRFHFRRARASIALAGFAIAQAELFAVELPVRTTGGLAWWHAARAATDHPAVAQRYREAVSLPRSLRPERMQRLYGVDRGLDLWRARAAHLAHGAKRRVVGQTRT